MNLIMKIQMSLAPGWSADHGLMLIREIVRAIGHRDEAKKRTILPGVVAAVPHDVCVFFSALHFMLLFPHRARVLRDCHTFRRMLFSACFACARAAAPRTGGFFAGFFRNHTRFCKNGCTHAAAEGAQGRAGAGALPALGFSTPRPLGFSTPRPVQISTGGVLTR